MPETLVFYTALHLDERLLETFLGKHFVQSEFVWTTNLYEYAAEHRLHSHKTYIAVETMSQGFKYQYSVFNNYDLGPSLKAKLEVLKQLSGLAKINIVSDDGEINTWTYILIEPNGQTSAIQLKNNNLLNVYDYFNFSFGAFRTKTKLSNHELAVLKKMLNAHYPDTKIHHGFDGPVIKGSFSKSKGTIVELKSFKNHYDIIPIGKNKWLDKNEKSELFIHLMSLFTQQTNNDLCLFPSNYSEVKNIEGGSDSDEYCLIITKDEVQRIIYKQRRKSWNS